VEAPGEDDVLTVLWPPPVLQIVDVVDHGGIVEDSAPRQICGRGTVTGLRSPHRCAGVARAEGRAARLTVQIVRVAEALDELKLDPETVLFLASRLSGACKPRRPTLRPRTPGAASGGGAPGNCRAHELRPCFVLCVTQSHRVAPNPRASPATARPSQGALLAVLHHTRQPCPDEARVRQCTRSGQLRWTLSGGRHMSAGRGAFDSRKPRVP